MVSCVDPVDPKYDFEESILLIRGEISDQQGVSKVIIETSRLFLGGYVTMGIVDAQVDVVDGRGVQHPFHLTDSTAGIYEPGPTFTARPEELYQLHLTWNGNQYLSTWETLARPVPIENISAEFDAEYEYSELRGEFIPAHIIRIDWQDPQDQVNYYKWSHTLFREDLFCLSCYGGIYRGGSECIELEELPMTNRFDYYCQEPCYSFALHTGLNVFSDEFVDGQYIAGKSVATVSFESRKPILIIVHQQVISPAQYRFEQLANELGVESGGVNNVLPGVIPGNIFNPENEHEKIIGFFGTKSTTSARIYIDRGNVMAIPLGEGIIPMIEPPDPPNEIPKSPCWEGPNKTKTKPEGWP